MSFNPLYPLGTLNKLISSVTWPLFPQLNVTASFLNREGTSLAFEGEVTRYLPTLTGAVTSPEPFQMVTLRLALLKTQPLAALYELQMDSRSLIGPGVVRTDSATLPPYELFNCGIMNVAELRFNGEDAGYNVTISGYVLRNAALWV